MMPKKFAIRYFCNYINLSFALPISCGVLIGAELIYLKGVNFD
jgi:hypothetical protein